jgi:hypothetical protein
VDVFAQGVPAHIGTPRAGYGYEAGDPYDAFLPPALRIGVDGSEDGLRAVVFVTGDTKKGTSRGAQEYESPLLVLIGAEYEVMRFQDLHDQLCDACEVGDHVSRSRSSCPARLRRWCSMTDPPQSCRATNRRSEPAAR